MLLLAILSAAIGLIWLAVFVRFGGLLAGSVGVVMLGVCCGWFCFHSDVGPLSLTSDRIALAGLSVLYGLYWIWGKADPKPFAIEDAVLTAFIGMLLLHVVFRPCESPDVNSLATFVYYFLSPAILYWIVRQSRLTERGVTALLISFVVLALYLAVTAVAEKQGWAALVFPRYIMDAGHEEFFGRGRGPLLNPIGNGLFMTVGFAGCVVLWGQSRTMGRMLLAAALPLIAAGLYCTMTRSVWLGAAVAAAIPATVYFSRSQNLGVCLVGALLVAGLLFFKGESMAAFKRDRQVSAHEMSQSAKLRPLLAAIALRVTQDQPFFGCGFQRYQEVSRSYINSRFTELPIEQARGYVQHNVFLALLVETGTVGLGLYVALLTFWCHHAWRLATSRQAPAEARKHGQLFLAFAAALIINGMFHDVGVIIMVNHLLMLLAGVAAGLAHQSPMRVSSGASQPMANVVSRLSPSQG